MKDEKESVSGSKGALGKPSRARNHTVLLDPSDMAAVREKLAEDIKRGFVETAKEPIGIKEVESVAPPAPPQFIAPVSNQVLAPPSFLPPIGGAGQSDAMPGGFGQTGLRSASDDSLAPGVGGESLFGRLSPNQGTSAAEFTSDSAPSIFGSGSIMNVEEDPSESSLVGDVFGGSDFGQPQMDPFGNSLMESNFEDYQPPSFLNDAASDFGSLPSESGGFLAAPELPQMIGGEPEEPLSHAVGIGLMGSVQENALNKPMEPTFINVPSEHQVMNEEGAEQMSTTFNSPVVDNSKDRIVWKKRSPVTGFLVSYDNDENGEWFPLQSGRVVVTSENDPAGDVLMIMSESVSPAHAIIKISKTGEVQVLDQLSEHGTRILRFDSDDEEELSGEKAIVAHGDVVQFGERSFYVVCVERE
jgi:hypothetical protein